MDPGNTGIRISDRAAHHERTRARLQDVWEVLLRTWPAQESVDWCGHALRGSNDWRQRSDAISNYTYAVVHNLRCHCGIFGQTVAAETSHFFTSDSKSDESHLSSR